MTVSHQQANRRSHSAGDHGFPWSHVAGYILSVFLTAFALWLAVAHAGRPVWRLSAILSLATAQIFVQLFLFMHITESHGPRYHVLALVLAAVFTVTVVIGSIWIMSFNGTQSY